VDCRGRSNVLVLLVVSLVIVDFFRRDKDNSRVTGVFHGGGAFEDEYPLRFPGAVVYLGP